MPLARNFSLSIRAAPSSLPGGSVVLIWTYADNRLVASCPSLPKSIGHGVTGVDGTAAPCACRALETSATIGIRRAIETASEKTARRDRCLMTITGDLGFIARSFRPGNLAKLFKFCIVWPFLSAMRCFMLLHAYHARGSLVAD